MAAETGPAPWNHEDYWKWRQAHKRVNKAQLEKQNVEWSLSSGYRQKEQWDRNPSQPKMKQVRLHNGRTVLVPDEDFDDFIGHQVSPTSDPTSAVGQYIDKAFEDMNRVQDVDGVGHIKYIEYVPTHQLLRVEFANDGAVVVFFRVPTAVYGELKYLAESGTMAISAVDGQQRHVLGIRFWDIVRIRGQRTGSKYKFEYAIEGTRMGSQLAQELAAGPAESVAAKRHETDEQLYDGFARNMLQGQTLEAYNKLTTVAAKAAFLRKAGII